MPAALIANPRRRRRGAKRRRNVLVSTNPRRRRRRNPGFNVGGIVSQVMREAIPATIAGAVVGFIDAKVAGRSALISYGTKVALAIVGQAVGHKLPMGIGSAITSAAFASIGYGFGIKMGGGVVAGSKEATAKELAAMAAEDGEMASILGAELAGMGVLVGMGEEGDPGVMGDDVDGLTDGGIGDDNE